MAFHRFVYSLAFFFLATSCASVHLTRHEREARMDPRTKKRGLFSATRQVAVDDDDIEHEQDPDAPLDADADAAPSEGLLFGGGPRHLRFPVPGDVSSPYGMRHGRMHKGVDLRAAKGTPIYPAAPGRVVFAGWIRGYGRTVRVAHEGYETLYAHCQTIYVAKGDEVGPGDRIASVGRSGDASGYHVHFEYINRLGKNEDPLRYLGGERAYSYAR